MICALICTFSYDYYMHLKKKQLVHIHTGKKPYICSCIVLILICQHITWTFDGKSNWYGIKPYICSCVCFLTHYTLHEHLKKQAIGTINVCDSRNWMSLTKNNTNMLSSTTYTYIYVWNASSVWWCMSKNACWFVRIHIFSCIFTKRVRI